MKKYLFAFTLLLLGLSGLAQEMDKDGRREQIKALQIAFITEKLDLSPAESQNFWPIHNAFEERSEAIKSLSRKMVDVEEMTDKQALDFVDSKISGEEKLTALKKQYVEDLKPVLSPKKIAVLFSIEHEFKRKMLRNIREQRHDHRRIKE